VLGVATHLSLVHTVLYMLPCLMFHVEHEERSFVVRFGFFPLVDCPTDVAYLRGSPGRLLFAHPNQNTLAFNSLRFLQLRFWVFSEVAGNSWAATFSDSLRSGTLRRYATNCQEALTEYFF